MIADVSAVLCAAMADGRSILFEGAQGTMPIRPWDIPLRHLVERDGRGRLHRARRIGPRSIHVVLGIAKAYTTRVGVAVPSELHGGDGDAAGEEANSAR